MWWHLIVPWWSCIAMAKLSNVFTFNVCWRCISSSDWGYALLKRHIRWWTSAIAGENLTGSYHKAISYYLDSNTAFKWKLSWYCTGFWTGFCERCTACTATSGHHNVNLITVLPTSCFLWLVRLPYNNDHPCKRHFVPLTGALLVLTFLPEEASFGQRSWS